MVDLREASEVGFELPSISKVITFEKVRAYSSRFGGTFLKTIHTDKNIAQVAGLPDVVCQGTMTLNYASEMLFNVYREHWINHSKIEVTFTKPVFPGDVITLSGVVKHRQEVDSAIHVELELWAENQAGDKVMTGGAGVDVAQQYHTSHLRR